MRAVPISDDDNDDAATWIMSLSAARFVRQGAVVAQEANRFVVGRRIRCVVESVRRRITSNAVQLPQPRPVAAARCRPGPSPRVPLICILVSTFTVTPPPVGVAEYCV